MPRRRTCPTSTSPWRKCAALPPRLPSYRLAARRPALGRFCAAQSADAPHRFASPASRATTVLAFRGRRFARPRSVSAEGRLLPNPSWSPSGPLHSLTSPESFPFEFATPPQTDPSPVPNAIAFESANPCTVEGLSHPQCHERLREGQEGARASSQTCSVREKSDVGHSGCWPGRGRRVGTALGWG